MPKIAATGRSYSGINVLILWDAVVARGFSCLSRLTFRHPSENLNRFSREGGPKRRILGGDHAFGDGPALQCGGA